MPMITAISPQKKKAGRVNVSLDGKFAFGLSTPVAARFGLRVGLELTQERVDELLKGQVYQKALDQALRHLAARAHSAKQIETKLGKKDYGPKVIEQVIMRLKEMGYLNDLDFALRKTDFAAKDKKLGQRRAAIDLMKAGVEKQVIKQALEAVYETHDSAKAARELALKQHKRLSKLDSITAKRRLMGLLLRRGYDYETVRLVTEEVLGEINEQDSYGLE